MEWVCAVGVRAVDTDLVVVVCAPILLCSTRPYMPSSMLATLGI